MTRSKSLRSHVTWLILGVVLLNALINTVKADLIAHTYFNEPTAVLSSVKYFDTGKPTEDHALINNNNQPIVNGASGTELGFTTYYNTTGSTVGLTDGDQLGVVEFPPLNKNHVFVMNDIDGIITTTFDTVSLVGFEQTKVSLQLFIDDVGWEASDWIRVWVTFEDAMEKDLINTFGKDIDTLAANIDHVLEEDSWFNLSTNLEDHDSATLAVSFKSNANDETIFIDTIEFTGEKANVITPVPVPSAFMIGSLGMAYATWFRSRMRFS